MSQVRTCLPGDLYYPRPEAPAFLPGHMRGVMDMRDLKAGDRVIVVKEWDRWTNGIVLEVLNEYRAKVLLADSMEGTGAVLKDYRDVPGVHVKIVG